MLSLWTWLALTFIVLIVGLIFYYYTRLLKQRDYFASAENETVFQNNCVSYGLTAREVQVVRLIVQGKTYAQVSDLLYISKKTVDSHMQNIYGKLGVRNKMELLQKLYR